MDDVAAPEIDRGRLRAMLAEHVKPGTVRWGHKLVATTPLGDGTHRLEFANGTTAEVDLVIGADSAWSRVRCLISDAVPRYTGAVREFLLKEFDGWSAELLAFISDNDGDFANRPIYALPAPLTWAHTPGATLLGDAAHLVTP
jgi:2-polyprenyl-6-methoxyphenol hydroxylase-like FAD-dependent oxidoreductase